MEEKATGMAETGGISPNATEDACPGAFAVPDAEKDGVANAEPGDFRVSETSGAEPDVSGEGESPAGDSRDAVLSEIRGIAEGIAADTRRAASELRNLHRLYHNEYTNRLIPLEEEMRFYHEAEQGRIHDEILRDVAKLYSENIAMLRQAEGTDIHKQLSNMFLDLLELLSAHGVRKQESAEGTVRNARYCQVIGREETEEPEKHNTVKRSVRVGFYADGFEKDGYRVNGRPLVKEMVEVFIYKKPDRTPEDA